MELIITEKPAAAQKIANALADGKPIKKTNNKVSYYEITRGNQDIIVSSAVGHLYTVEEVEKKGFEYPVFDIKWIPSADSSKDAAYTRKYLTTIKKLAKKADSFTVATDYDVEGEVIGYNIVKHVCGKQDAYRMKFSTLTKDELSGSYDGKMSNLDWGQANAGLTRHELDWFYGINLSRALTSSIKATGSFKIMSSGRVQGPALKILAEREKEINNFKPEPFWQIELDGKLNSNDIEAWHSSDKIWNEEDANKIVERTKGRNAKVDDVNKRDFKQAPPTPFDLTTLQTESYKCLGISPKETLQIAQELYTSGVISYPRTSSQKLSEKLGFRNILKALSKDEKYKKLADKLMGGKLKPNNGKKDDPAHPAIYPTGALAKVEGKRFKVYDLIVRRFMATFGEPAKRQTVKIDVNCNDEHFFAKGTRTLEPGWHLYYGPYLKIDEQEMPACKKGDGVINEKIKLHAKETQPPKRYTQASIIKELEKRNLGTKATRASVVDTLYQRKYIREKKIEVTDLGIKTIDTLKKYSPSILDEELTKHFEDEMEEIRNRKKKPQEVIEEAKKVLRDILDKFKKHEKDIGNELISAYRETQQEENTMGGCPHCKGNLVIKKGKFGRFVACDNYPDCKATFKIPQQGMIKSLDKSCQECGYPMVSIMRKGKKPQRLCINPECPAKKTEKPEKIDKKCPKCGSELKLRKSIYGQFIGCSNYPKCKYTEQTGSETGKEE